MRFDENFAKLLLLLLQIKRVVFGKVNAEREGNFAYAFNVECNEFRPVSFTTSNSDIQINTGFLF